MSGGFSNPIVGGGGALVYPSIHSPNFNIANPGASPNPSWAILKNGLAYFFGLVLAGGTIIGPDYIINTSGAFFYGGAPAAGNLTASVTSSSGTDGFGNAYQSGLTSYDAFGNYTQMSAAQLTFFSSVAPGFAGLQVSDTDVLEVVGTPGVASFQVTVPVSRALTASSPSGFGTAETWHAMILGNGWTGTARYKLMPDNTVMIQTDSGSIGGGANASGTQIWAAPAGYVPAFGQQPIPLYVSSVGAGSAATALSPYLQISATGALTIVNVAAQNATVLRFSGSYALD